MSFAAYLQRIGLIGNAALFLRGLSIAALAGMMLVTVIDISMRLILNRLVLGSVEVVQFTIVAVVFLALPETFLRGQQVTVDAIDQFVTPRTQQKLHCLASVATLALLVAMYWHVLPFALDTLVIGDLTTDLQISLFWYWVPIIIGGGASVLIMIQIVARELIAIGRPLSAASEDSTSAQ